MGARKLELGELVGGSYVQIVLHLVLAAPPGRQPGSCVDLEQRASVTTKNLRFRCESYCAEVALNERSKQNEWATKTYVE